MQKENGQQNFCRKKRINLERPLELKFEVPADKKV